MVVWPLPSQLYWATAPAGDPGVDATQIKVDVSLLDGQQFRGILCSASGFGTQLTLALTVLRQALAVPVVQVRSVIAQVALAQLTVPLPESQVTVARAANTPSVEHQELLSFRVVYIDGTLMEGTTWGYANYKAGGLYLYVRQADSAFQAVWIPRAALREVHLDRPRLNPSTISEAVQISPETVGPATTMAELLGAIEKSRCKPMPTFTQAMRELQLLNEETFSALRADSSALRTYLDVKLASSELSPIDLEHARAHMLKTPEVNVAVFACEPQATSRLHWDVASQNAVVPLGMLSGLLYVACAHPLSRELQDRLAVIAGCGVVLVWAPKLQIDQRVAREIQRLMPTTQISTTQAALTPILSDVGDLDAPDIQTLMASARDEINVRGVQIHSYTVDEHSSVVLLVKRLIQDAYRQKASDIHIETNPDNQLSRVRFRKDGELEEYLQLPSDLRAALVSRIKVMSKLDISERRRPQDGKINFADFSDLKLELRVAVVPTHDNLEDVVLRLLASSKPIPLAQLGFSARDANAVKVLSQKPFGLILACGPTGSGKTTTLHSLLSEINTDSRKIWTAEDPIEITQVGLRQLQVNPKIGVTFATAMRAFLRADPDVIMIGEVRDAETARTSIEASLTGHLVMSTLHTNNAAESVVRLLDLGMDPMNFGDSLLGIVAQRLVRALCKHCKQAVAVTDEALASMCQEYAEGTHLEKSEVRTRLLAVAQPTEDGVLIYKAVGCQLCSGKGYKGRMGIYEILVNGPELKQLIQTRAATSRIFEQAIATGTRSLRQDALEKVFAGHVDLLQARTVYS